MHNKILVEVHIAIYLSLFSSLTLLVDNNNEKPCQGSFCIASKFNLYTLGIRMTQPLIRHTAPHSLTARSTQTKNIALQNERVVDLKTRSRHSRSLAWYFLSPLDIKTTDLVPSLQSYKSLPGQIIAAIAVIAQARNEVETLSK